jgi:alpha-mannosidase
MLSPFVTGGQRRREEGGSPKRPLRVVTGDVIVETVKPAEDKSGIILRFYETRGRVQALIPYSGTTIRIAGRMI